jgi:hypothetical protein
MNVKYSRKIKLQSSVTEIIVLPVWFGEFHFVIKLQ